MAKSTQRDLNLVDIARRSGVSRSTVSRVVNDDPYVSDSTRAKVLAVINEVGYVPNTAARMLRRQRSQIIALVIPDPFTNVLSTDNPYYYTTVIQNINEVTQQRDYAMLLWVGGVDESKERFYERILKNRIMDGILVASSVEEEGHFVRELMSLKLPFVIIGRPLLHTEEINFVTVDNVSAAEKAVKHLLVRGRRRIATITGDWDNVDSRERLEGYQRALTGAGIPYDETLVIRGRFNQQCGYEAMQELLAARPDIDGLFAASDIIAYGAITAIQESGRQVPADIAVVGFDDLPSAAAFDPPLTTIRHPIKDKSREAATLLLNVIESGDDMTRAVLLPTDLVVRKST